MKLFAGRLLEGREFFLFPDKDHCAPAWRKECDDHAVFPRKLFFRIEDFHGGISGKFGRIQSDEFRKRIGVHQIEAGDSVCACFPHFNVSGALVAIDFEQIRKRSDAAGAEKRFIPRHEPVLRGEIGEIDDGSFPEFPFQHGGIAALPRSAGYSFAERNAFPEFRLTDFPLCFFRFEIQQRLRKRVAVFIEIHFAEGGNESPAVFHEFFQERGAFRIEVAYSVRQDNFIFSRAFRKLFFEEDVIRIMCIFQGDCGSVDLL